MRRLKRCAGKIIACWEFPRPKTWLVAQSRQQTSVDPKRRKEMDRGHHQRFGTVIDLFVEKETKFRLAHKVEREARRGAGLQFDRCCCTDT